MPHRNRFAKGGLARHNDAHAVLLNALADKENSYRRWMRPADIIAQNMSERRQPKLVALSPGFAELLWKFLRREFKRMTATGCRASDSSTPLPHKAETVFHSQ